MTPVTKREKHDNEAAYYFQTKELPDMGIMFLLRIIAIP